ncbi:MAG: septum formation initiator family protein [Patescibacteria group bacterium]
MSFRFSYTSSFTKLIIIVEFILVAYLLYSLTRNVYNSYQVDNLITQFEEENAKIEEGNRQKNEDYLYFTSEEYIDKIAKQNLGLINPGEEVIILSPELVSSTSSEEQESTETGVTKYYKMSNPQQWWYFFFGN